MQQPLPPTALSKNERRRTASFRKANDPLEYLRQSTAPDVKEVRIIRVLYKRLIFV